MKKIKEYIKKIMDWVRIDGLLHIETEALITLMLAIIFPLQFCVVLALAIGIFKEIADDNNPKHMAELHDFICDGIGIVVGVIIYLLL